MSARVVALGLALGVACAPVRADVSGAPARNTCTDGPCPAYKQTGTPPSCTADLDICQAKAKLDLTVVVTVPEGGAYAPGETFVANYAKLAKARTCRVAPACLLLPSLGEFAGVYSATNEVATTDGYYLAGGVRSLPTVPMFRRAWSFVEGALPVDVALIGLPLQPVVGTPAWGDQSLYPAATDHDGAKTPSVGFNVLVPAGPYEETLSPAGQFTAPFPPVVVPNALPTAPQLPHDFRNVQLGSEYQQAQHDITVTRGGGLPLVGWTLFLRDERTKRPISTAPRLTRADKVAIFTVNQQRPLDPPTAVTVRDGIELVLAPPQDEAPRLPDLVLTVLANRVSPVVPYPLLPFQATVEGTVVGDDGSGVEGDVVVVSQSITMLDSDLSYVDSFPTASNGTFSRMLPPGKYSAIVTPSTASGLAKTIVDLEVTVPAAPGLRQGGKVLSVVHPDLLRGSVRAADGRILADAEVEARPSTLLPYGADTVARDSRRWPRVVRTRTNGAGEFVVPVDPGGVFDVFVRPSPGTNFPWVVQQQVTTPRADLAIEVPAPYVVSAQLQDPGGLAVAQALVQAFIGGQSPVPGAACTADNDARNPTASGTCPPLTPRCANGHCAAVVAVEIGRARTDDQGRFTLFLDGRPR